MRFESGGEPVSRTELIISAFVVAIICLFKSERDVNHIDARLKTIEGKLDQIVVGQEMHDEYGKEAGIVAPASDKN